MKAAMFNAVLLLAACASDIMQGYVGRDISAVVASYGPPYQQFELPDGRIAYQWRIVEFEAQPHVTYYYEEQNGKRITGQSTSYGGYVVPETCFYTFYTRPDGKRATIVGFEKPSIGCE